MVKKIVIQSQRPQYLLDQNVAFAQVDSWFGNVTRNLTMNIIYARDTKEKRPCVIWCCGGAFLQMDSGAHIPYLCELAKAGFVVAAVQYRTSNEAQFPAQVCDIKSAVRYLRAHADRYGIDMERFGIMGDSAGGYLAAMTALTGNDPLFEQGDYKEVSSLVQAVCTWYMPSDLVKMVEKGDMDSRAAMPESLFIGDNISKEQVGAGKADPFAYITQEADIPPFLLIHGTDDKTVPVEHSEMMYRKLQACRKDAELIEIEGADHGGIEFFQEEIWEKIIGFFHEKL